MFWYRAWLTFGRPSLLGTTVKDPQNVPTDLVADEKVTWGAGQEVYVPTTVDRDCFLGVSVVAAADTAALETGYGEFAQEAPALAPTYQPRSVCTDGWHATREAWRRLFPTITLVLGFLHSVLKIMDQCGARCGMREWRRPGGSTRPRRNASSPSACGAWRRGRQRTAVGRWPRWS